MRPLMSLPNQPHGQCFPFVTYSPISKYLAFFLLLVSTHLCAFFVVPVHRLGQLDLDCCCRKLLRLRLFLAFGWYLFKYPWVSNPWVLTISWLFPSLASLSILVIVKWDWFWAAENFGKVWNPWLRHGGCNMLVASSEWIFQILFTILKYTEKPSRTKKYWDSDAIGAKVKQCWPSQ